MKHNIYLARHVSHDKTSLDDLSSRGRDEANLLANTIGNHIETIYTPGSQRFLSTANLISPNAKIEIDESLDYKISDNREYNALLTSKTLNKKCLRFTVEKSDNFYSAKEISTYSSMAKAVGRAALKAETESIILAREFMHASFRTKIINLALGKRASENYVDFYTENVEKEDKARIEPIKIETDNFEYRLSDSFGELEFDRKALQMVADGDKYRLISLRGNSGSGKSTIAQELKKSMGDDVLVIDGDVLYNDFLNHNTSKTIALIKTLALYARNNKMNVIIEGVLPKEKYEDTLLFLADEFPDSKFYYFDISLTETLKRHDGRLKRYKFGKDKMVEWYRKDNKFELISETTINDNDKQSEILARILSDLK